MPVPIEYALHDPDITLSKAIRSKQIDDERKERLFDSKRRLIGVDVDALNAQVEEKNSRRQSEKELNRKYRIYNDVLYREEQRMKSHEQWERRKALEELKNYWKVHQRREFSRDFDLNDPDYLKKSLPMCTGDNDPRIKSKGSFLRFDGEDYDGRRAKKQSSKLKQLLDDQIREKEEYKKSCELADNEWVNEAAAQSDFNNKCTELEQRVRKEEIKQVQAYNFILAKEKQNEKEWEKKRSYSEDLAHVYNCLTSSFFLESGKEGVTPEQLQEIKETQKIQIIELEKRKADEIAMNDYCIQLSATKAREEEIMARNNEIRRRDEAVRIREINRILAIEQRQRRKEAEREAHNCNPTEEFFAQFNKTAK